MKQYIILAVTIIVLAVFSFWQIKFLNNAKEQIDAIVKQVQSNLQIDNYMAASIGYKELESKWKKLHNGIDAFSDHMDVETFEKTMASLKVYIDEKERTTALEQCSILVQVIEHIVESENLSIASVF